MPSLWKYRQKIRNFVNLTPAEQQDVVDNVLAPTAYNAYRHEYWVSILASELTQKDHIEKLAETYFDNVGAYGDMRDACQIISVVYDRLDKDEIKKKVKECVRPHVVRCLLTLDDLTEDEEVLGLRALSKATQCPDVLYTKQYKPSPSAIGKLPPVMRLSALETLLNNRHFSYNIMEKFGDADEFKSLMFGTAFKHRERVAAVCHKYDEIVNVGKEAIIMVKSTCDNCGEYSISLNSKVARTEVGLKGTHIGRYMLNRHNCMLCGRYGETARQIICEE